MNNLVNLLMTDDRLKGESWTSLTYRSDHVELRRYPCYCEMVRINDRCIDFELYIGLSDNLWVFNSLQKILPELESSLTEKYPGLHIEYRTKPAINNRTGLQKKTMALAHFYIPAGNTDMFRDVYVRVHDAVKDIDKGTEVIPRR